MSRFERILKTDTSERVAAVIRVSDGHGHERCIFETWKSLDRFGLVAERQFRLSTGEAVAQLAENVFVVLTTNETLMRLTRATTTSSLA